MHINQGSATFLNAIFFIVSANVAGMGACYALELSARHTFIANYLLAIERDNEQRKREQSESMLHVLSQAIGVIVHDLGTPLTSIQLGADTLEMSMGKGEDDKETSHRIIGYIKSGSQMLNYLRLSLMEQLRVLEGKPIPLDLRIVSLKSIIESGVRYQKSRFTSGRGIIVADIDIEIALDEMKMITVFMNLIGNALKYSDGPVHIDWNRNDDTLLIAVSDVGRAGHGITQAQASQLFVAFGRLETHKNIEGTGFGLLSAQKIVEAHDGELFIEGHADGVATSPPFSGASQNYVSMLKDGFRTAFVIALPLR